MSDSEKPIEQLRAEERVVNEVVPHAVDVRIDHQRIDKTQNQHHPERCVGVEEEESQEISEMKQARHCRDRIPARVREEPGVCCGPLYSNKFRGHFEKIGGIASFATEKLLASFEDCQCRCYTPKLAAPCSRFNQN